jgi:predicted dehydrogenase
MVYTTAVIGCGRVGSLFDSDSKRKNISSHCGAYNKHNKTKLVSVCDIDINKATLAKNKWKVNSSYTDYKKMLQNEEIDILSICTNPDTHLEIIDNVVNYGIKAIFCEKPLALNLNEAKDIISLCEKYNVLLAVNHFRRWDKFFQELKININNNKFGNIQFINYYYTRGIANTGSHLFDILRLLFGEIQSVRSYSSINDIENDHTISSNLIFENGIKCNLIGLDGRNYRIFDLEIFGANAKVVIDTSKNVKLYKSDQSLRSSEFNELYESKYCNSLHLNDDVFLNSLNDIILCIESDSNPKCNGYDGFKSLELIIASKKSYFDNVSIALPLNNELYNMNI